MPRADQSCTTGFYVDGLAVWPLVARTLWRGGGVPAGVAAFAAAHAPPAPPEAVAATRLAAVLVGLEAAFGGAAFSVAPVASALPEFAPPELAHLIHRQLGNGCHEGGGGLISLREIAARPRLVRSGPPLTGGYQAALPQLGGDGGGLGDIARRLKAHWQGGGSTADRAYALDRLAGSLTTPELKELCLRLGADPAGYGLASGPHRGTMKAMLRTALGRAAMPPGDPEQPPAY